MKIGLALGGGGVRGLAHIPLLRILEDEGVEIQAVAGTSMGALVGACVAHGWDSRELRERVERHVLLPDGGLGQLREKGRELSRWLGFFALARDKGAFFSADGFIRYLLGGLESANFDDLAIPFHAVATDFADGRKVVFSDGPLLPALKASIAIPGVFEPVRHDGRLLVDGGVADNVPWSVLDPSCDAVLAIDVANENDCSELEGSGEPDAIESFVSIFQRMIARTTAQRRALDPPALYFRPRLANIRGLDFGHIPEVFVKADTETERFRQEVRKLLDGRRAHRSGG